MTRKLILDLDTGIDDTLAIAYALASEQADDVRLIGITGTYGNVTVETGMRNALAGTARAPTRANRAPALSQPSPAHPWSRLRPPAPRHPPLVAAVPGLVEAARDLLARLA